MTDINKVTKRFGRAYERNVKAKNWLAKQQKALFAAFDADLVGRQTRQRSIQIPEGEDVNQYIKRYHPGWEYVTRSDDWVVLRENPSLMSHSYTNIVDGQVYGRAQVTGTPSLDDDRLRQEDPDLWERITEMPEPWWSLVHDVFARAHTYWSEELIDTMTIDHLQMHGVQRTIKDLNTLSNRDLALVEEYIMPGPVSVRLNPPRKVKPEESG